MATRTIATRLSLRRDTEAKFKPDFLPLKGEILLVDTTSNELRSKIGDGIHTFAQLPYSDQNIKNLVSGIVVQGYYHNGHFYTDKNHIITIVPYSYKIYIDRETLDIYGYFDEEQCYCKLSQISTATSETAGIVKLYDNTGQNVDGTMTQRSITTELGKKTEVSIGDDENLIFNN